MDNKSLEAFIILADTLHYRKASAMCHITTSALSRMIQRIEMEVGCVLFDRNNKEVAITTEGVMFYDYAKATLFEWNEIQRDIAANYPEKVKGDVHICCSVSVAGDIFLSKILEPFLKKYKNVRPIVEAIPSTECGERLMEGTTDFLISMLLDKPLKQFVRKVITSSELVFIYPASMEGPKDAKDLVNFPIGISKYKGITEKTERFFRRNRVKPNIVAYIDGVEGIISSVADGLMSAVLPRNNLEQYTLGSKIKVADNIDIGEETHHALIMKKKEYHSPAKQALWNMVNEEGVFPAHKYDSYK